MKVDLEASGRQRSRALFGIGPMELVVIAIVILVVVGPQRLPEMMRHLGKFVVYARRYSSDLRNEFNQVIRDAETDLRVEEAKKLRQQIQDEIAAAGQHQTTVEAKTTDPRAEYDHPEAPLSEPTSQSTSHEPKLPAVKKDFDLEIQTEDDLKKD